MTTAHQDSELLYAYFGDDRNDPHAVVLDLEVDDHNRLLCIPANPHTQHLVVRDRRTGLWWAVRPTACPGDCYCALEAHPAPAPSSTTDGQVRN